MNVLLVVLLVAVSGGLLALLYRRASASMERTFTKTPLVRVAEAAPGAARLSGRAVAVDAVPVSEASGRPFVARELAIVPSSDGSDGTHRFAQAVDFLLDDGSGIALVRGVGGRVSADRDYEAPVVTLDEVPWVDELLRSGGYHNGSPATCRVRLYEGVISDGATVGVVGQVEAPDDAARALGAVAVVRGTASAPVMIRAERREPGAS